MKAYLVTVGAGFIGLSFIHYMFKKYTDIKIIWLDKLAYASNHENLKSVEKNPNYNFIQGDLCDKELNDDIMKAG